MNISSSMPVINASQLIATSGLAQAQSAATMMVMKDALDNSASQAQSLIASMPMPVEGHIDVRV